MASERPSKSWVDQSSSYVLNGSGSSADQKSVSYQPSNVITETDENYEEDDFESLA